MSARVKKSKSGDLLVPTLYQVEPRQRGCGRPLFDGKNENEVVAKLQYAFSIDATTSEACNLAGISTDSFYRYCQKYPEFRNKIDCLRSTVVLLARKTVAEAIFAGDIKTSFWYLERKRPQEFSPRCAEQCLLQQQDRMIEYLKGLLIENGVDFL